LKNSEEETGNTYRILVVNNTETVTTTSNFELLLKQRATNFGPDVATVVINAIQKYPFGVTIKNKTTGIGKILCYIFST